MLNNQRHLFYLLNPSPWHFLAAIAVFVMMNGSVTHFHSFFLFVFYAWALLILPLIITYMELQKNYYFRIFLNVAIMILFILILFKFNIFEQAAEKDITVKVGNNDILTEALSIFVNFLEALRAGYTDHAAMQLPYNRLNGKWDEIEEFIENGMKVYLDWALITSKNAVDFANNISRWGEYLQKTKELGEARIRFYENFIKTHPSHSHISEVIRYLKFIERVDNIFEKKMEVWRNLVKSRQYDIELKKKLIELATKKI